MKCNNEKCLYIEYLKELPLVYICIKANNNKLYCTMCDRALTLDDVIEYVRKDENLK